MDRPALDAPDDAVRVEYGTAALAAQPGGRDLEEAGLPVTRRIDHVVEAGVDPVQGEEREGKGPLRQVGLSGGAREGRPKRAERVPQGAGGGPGREGRRR